MPNRRYRRLFGSEKTFRRPGSFNRLVSSRTYSVTECMAWTSACSYENWTELYSRGECYGARVARRLADLHTVHRMVRDVLI